MNTHLGHSGSEWRRQRNASGVLMTDNTYGVGTEFLSTDSVVPWSFLLLFLKTALQLLFGLILFCFPVCVIWSLKKEFSFFSVLAEADLISSAVAMFGNFSFRMLFCD